VPFSDVSTSGLALLAAASIGLLDVLEAFILPAALPVCAYALIEMAKNNTRAENFFIIKGICYNPKVRCCNTNTKLYCP
jgi:hypothetical protein